MWNFYKTMTSVATALHLPFGGVTRTLTRPVLKEKNGFL